MTSSPSNFKPWDVVVVPFPYSDHPDEKVRPAVVLSSPRHIKATGVCYVAMITSAQNPSWEGDVLVTNLRATGLPVPSVVRPAKVMSLNTSRIVRRIGSLPKADRENVISTMQLFLAS